MYKLINEFDEIGWDKISNLKSDLHSLTINIKYSLLFIFLFYFIILLLFYYNFLFTFIYYFLFLC